MLLLLWLEGSIMLLLLSIQNVELLDVVIVVVRGSIMLLLLWLEGSIMLLLEGSIMLLLLWLEGSIMMLLLSLLLFIPQGR